MTLSPRKTSSLLKNKCLCVLASGKQSGYPGYMCAINNLLSHVLMIFLFIWESLQYAVLFFWPLFCPRAAMATRLLAAAVRQAHRLGKSQLAMCCNRIRQKKEPKPRFTSAFRLLWITFAKTLDGWEDLLHLMKPATVKAWHTMVRQFDKLTAKQAHHMEGFRLYWRWKSRKGGRPSIEKEMQDLIRRLSRENPLWGAKRIRDTLFMLGYCPPCEDTVRKYMVTPRKPGRKSQTWLPFLRNHLDVSWAIDFFTVTTVKFTTLYVFLIFDHGRRRVVHFKTTYTPSMNWVVQQLLRCYSFRTATTLYLP